MLGLLSRKICPVALRAIQRLVKLGLKAKAK